ncbi:MAG: hypothetical protein IPJ71_11575 [Bdellovibrionales bacterium]|nr:hypothetical protein [Bdellovibrionales bacterium]
MAVELKIYPRKYKEKNKPIYIYMRSKKVSVDYANKIIGLLNRWGRFVSATEGSYFEPVKPPRGNFRSAIAEAQRTKAGKNSELGARTESLLLSPDLLKKTRANFTDQNHYNWLEIPLWFGLRPSEVDVLHNKKFWQRTMDKESGQQVLSVYQSKLVGMMEKNRYKHIPILFKVQRDCLSTIKREDFQRPHSKTVRKDVADVITLYGVRKCFTDLMLSKWQKNEDISIWLGHTSIETTTWKHYKDRKRISFTLTDTTLVGSPGRQLRRIG